MSCYSHAESGRSTVLSFANQSILNHSTHLQHHSLTSIIAMSATAFANLVGLQPQAIYPATIIAETPPAHPSEIMMYLVAMPRLREVILRPSRVISLHDWNSRRQNREAGLAQTRGNITSEACDHCERGAGPFNQCVTVPDLLNGGCSNCHYMDRAYRCSLTPGNELIIIT